MIKPVAISIAVSDINPIDTRLKFFISVGDTSIMTDSIINTAALPYIILAINPAILWWRKMYVDEMPVMIFENYEFSVPTLDFERRYLPMTRKAAKR